MSTSPLGRNRVQIREGIQSIHTRHESGLRKPAAARSSSSHVWISYGGVCHQAMQEMGKPTATPMTNPDPTITRKTGRSLNDVFLGLVLSVVRRWFRHFTTT